MVREVPEAVTVRKFEGCSESMTHELNSTQHVAVQGVDVYDKLVEMEVPDAVTSNNFEGCANISSSQ